MNSILDVATLAAKRAGDFIREASDDIAALTIEEKSTHDYVSQIDRCAENLIVDLISEQFIDHQIYGEEFGQQGSANAEYRWVIDPLDGTTNFLRRIPHYAVSIGVEHAGEVEYAVVYDPSKDELFQAARGLGARLNGELITTQPQASIEGALLSTGIPFSGENLNSIDSFSATMTELLECQTSGIRRLGAAALDLAYVAAGRYDGFWETNLKSWDIAAGVLLVEEAGGVVSDLQGGQSFMTSGNILAASTHVHEDMLRVTSKYYSSQEKARNVS